jgi:hypothetical protein
MNTRHLRGLWKLFVTKEEIDEKKSKERQILRKSLLKYYYKNRDKMNARRKAQYHAQKNLTKTEAP